MVLWREHMIMRRPYSRTATRRARPYKISKLPDPQPSRLNDKLGRRTAVRRRKVRPPAAIRWPDCTYLLYIRPRASARYLRDNGTRQCLLRMLANDMQVITTQVGPWLPSPGFFTGSAWLTGGAARESAPELATGEAGFNCDFHAIRHHGTDAVLEKHYVPREPMPIGSAARRAGGRLAQGAQRGGDHFPADRGIQRVLLAA